jgi:hypothetical protein
MYRQPVELNGQRKDAEAFSFPEFLEMISKVRLHIIGLISPNIG